MSKKGIAAWLKPKHRQALTIKEKEERDLQRAIELSQQTQRKENEQRARFELLAARTLEMSKQPYHRHDKEMPFVNGEEDDRFETLTNRIVKKEKIGSSSRSRRRQGQQQQQQQQQKRDKENKKEKETDKQKRKEEGDIIDRLQQDHQIKEEKEEEEEEIIFDVDEIDQWLAEDDDENVEGYTSHTDPLASSPPSPYLHQFNSDDGQQLSSELPSKSGSYHEREEEHGQSDNDDNQDEDTALCPLCRRKVSRSLLYQHTLGCPGDFSNDNTTIDSNDHYDDPIGQHSEQYITSVDSSPSIRALSLIPRRSSFIQESVKRKSSKSMAAGVIQEQKRQKSLNMSSSRRSYNHYSVHDAELEEHFDTAGFGGNVSGLSWEARGQSRYR